MSRAGAKIREWFSIDVRSLALFRIAAGLFMLADLAWRATTLTAFYTDAGVAPRAILVPPLTHLSHWSFHSLGGSVAFEAALFVLNGLVLGAFVIGYRTRLATFLSWAFLLSLNNRNPLVLQAGDTLLCLGLLWAVFLPLGEAFSVDTLSRPRHRRKRVYGVAPVAFSLQVIVVYWLTAYFKLRYDDWQDGSAVSHALGLLEFTTPLGLWLRQHAALTTLFTHATVWFEIGAPFLLFSPLWTGPVRFAAILAFWGLHVGFGLCLHLGSFPWISSLMMLPFVPTWFWARTRLAFLPLSPPLPRLSLGRLLCDLPVAALLLAMLWALLPSMLNGYRLPGSFARGAGFLRMTQNWAMFADLDQKPGWDVVDAELENGSHVDLWLAAPEGKLSWERPAVISETYPDWRWRKVMMALPSPRAQGIFPPLVGYLARRYERNHPQGPSVKQVTVVRMTQENPLPAPAVPVVLWKGKPGA